MIAIDALLLLNVVCFAVLVWMLMRLLALVKEQRKIIADLERCIDLRAALIARLLHEADKHGSDDLALLAEAKKVACIDEPDPEGNGVI